MISLGLVYYSGEEDFIKAIQSLCLQSFSDFEILVRDQSSSRFAFQYLSKYYAEYIQQEKIRIFYGENIFHSGGHNFLLSKMKGDIYVCGSIDMEYHNQCLEYIQSFMKDPKKEYATGKVLNSTGTQIDSAGIIQEQCFRFVDRGQGKEKSLYSQDECVFGASGALCVLKKSLIKKLQYQDGIVFDPTMHYKNDVDLACRIFLLGKLCWYDARIYAKHHRATGKNSQKSEFAQNSSFQGQQILFHKYSGTPLLPSWKGVLCRWIHWIWSRF